MNLDRTGAATAGRMPSAAFSAMLPADSATEHTVATKNGSLRYTATAGTFTLYAQSGEASAKIFYTAYVAHDDKAAGDTDKNRRAQGDP